MNAGLDDDELEFTAVDVEPNKQSNDPPPESTGAKQSELKSYRKKVKLWLLCSCALQLSYKGHVFRAG